jgi:hypothetical protein
VNRNVAIVLGALALAGGSGFLASSALSGSQQAPTKTVTVDVATGPAGPPGPPGPQGPQGPAGTGGGAESCPTGSTFTAVRINAPSGHVTIWTCVAD